MRKRERKSARRDETPKRATLVGKGTAEYWSTYVVNSRSKICDSIPERDDLRVVGDDSVETDLSNVDRESERVGFDELRDGKREVRQGVSYH